MFSKTYTPAALFVASLVAQVNAVGNAIIKNQCSSDVYVWTVSSTPGEMQTIASGEQFSEPYQTNSNGGGISMKIATQPDQAGPITQFEYTLTNDFWYDISNINGFPFVEHGLTLIPSDSSCRSMVCSAGVQLCTAAYNQPDDNEATAMCTPDSDMTLVLCSGQVGNTPAAAASSIASNIASFIAPVANVGKVVAAAATSAAPAAPVVTPAPVAAPVENGAHVFTTFVTQVVTVIAERAAEASPVADAKVEKRASHRHHFHRHGADSN